MLNTDTTKSVQLISETIGWWIFIRHTATEPLICFLNATAVDPEAPAFGAVIAHGQGGKMNVG